jgi:hypothetical protein
MVSRPRHVRYLKADIRQRGLIRCVQQRTSCRSGWVETLKASGWKAANALINLGV